MAGEIKASITGKKGEQKLVLEIPVYRAPVPSSTGKSLTVASTRGNVTTDLVVDGKPVVVGVNAYLKLPKE